MKSIILCLFALLIMTGCSYKEENKSLLSNIDLNSIETVDNNFIVSDFNYIIQDNDQIDIFIYEYKKEGISNIFVSEIKIESDDEQIINKLNNVLSSINNKNAIKGILYGPAYSIKFHIENDDYDMEIMMGTDQKNNNTFITIKVTEEDTQKYYFTMENEFTDEINYLINELNNNK